MNKYGLTLLLCVLGHINVSSAKEDYSDPIIRTLRAEIKKELVELDPKPTFEVPRSSDARTLIVRYRTRDYHVHTYDNKGRIRGTLSSSEGPSDEGFLLNIHIQYLGRTNNAVTLQPIQHKHWKEDVAVYKVEKEFKQIYFSLSYNTKTDPDLIATLKKIADRVRLDHNKQVEINAVPGKLTPGEVCFRIRKGDLGKELAERANKTDNLWMQEVEQNVIDNQIFCGGNGINLLVEDGKLILLCPRGWGAGPLFDLTVISNGKERVLKYSWTIGSGIQRTIQGQYLLGSGKGGGIVTSLEKQDLIQNPNKSDAGDGK